MQRGVVVALVAALASSVGCGGSSKDDAPKRGGFAQQVDRVCQQGRSKVSGVLSQKRGTESAARAKLIAIVDDMVDELETLEPPDDLRDQYKTFRTVYREDINASLGRPNRARGTVEQRRRELQSLRRQLHLRRC